MAPHMRPAQTSRHIVRTDFPELTAFCTARTKTSGNQPTRSVISRFTYHTFVRLTQTSGMQFFLIKNLTISPSTI